MPRPKRAQVTTMESPAKPATSSSATSTSTDKKSGNGRASFDVEATIRARAYELYEKRGRSHGFAQDDWLQAEMEVLSRVSRTA